MTDLERAIRHIKTRADAWAVKEVEKALSQEPCEKQIKIGTKVRTTKDKDFACEKVFPVGTIGIVECIDKGDNLPYKIVANNDYFYYSRDMFEIIEDVEPCDDAISRDEVMGLVAREHTEWDDLYIDIAKLPSVTQKSGKWIDREVYDADRWKCSVCGRTEQYKENYCPNCGAKMESEDKE